jgi:CRP/FNR family cyclic AMP-dependent transcriptional regulator
MENLSRILVRMSDAAKEALVQQIREGSPLFAAMSQENLATLLEIGRSTNVPAAQVLFHKGDEPDRFFVVVAGSARASAPSHDGRDLVVRLFAAGDICGEIAVLDGGARTADVTTTEPCELLVFERNRFNRYLIDHPEVTRELAGILARRLRQTTELLSDNAFLGVPARLAKVLLSLARSRGGASADDKVITIELSQQELAEMVGTSRVSINKQLREWEEQGLVEIKRRRLTIHDIGELEDFADVGL